jgi:uncharacterized DUF497 family protein
VRSGDDALEVDGLVFLWNRRKAAANRRKHGVTFDEAASVFADPVARVREDRGAGHGERRMQILGYSVLGRVLLVVHVEVHDETIRIISARKLDARERRRLERE